MNDPFKSRKLRIWNGGSNGLLPPGDGQGIQVYACAYTVDDARRVCLEAGYGDPGREVINRLWIKGYWGPVMAGIALERGLWMTLNEGKTVRIPLTETVRILPSLELQPTLSATSGKPSRVPPRERPAEAQPPALTWWGQQALEFPPRRSRSKK